LAQHRRQVDPSTGRGHVAATGYHIGEVIQVMNGTTCSG
jgi:hypothetical protein